MFQTNSMVKTSNVPSAASPDINTRRRKRAPIENATINYFVNHVEHSHEHRNVRKAYSFFLNHLQEIGNKSAALYHC